MYVIWNLTQKKYVAWNGSASSYTKRLRDAQKFTTLPEAMRDCCGDETVRSVAELIGQRA